MKKTFFILSAVFVLAFLSCKKKETTPDAPAASTTGSNTALNYDGLLGCQEISMVSSGTIVSTSGNCQVVFPTGGFYNSSTISDGFLGTAVNAGTVSLNSIILKPANQSSNVIYDDTTATVHNAPLAWSVSGGNGIPALNYTYTAARPVYSGWNTLQDTIKVNQNTVINLTGITGADEILVYLIGTGMVSKVLPGNSTSVSFSTSELTALSTSSSASLWIACSKYSIVSISGKNFKFKITRGIIKSIVPQ
jgi:hypothetical protein